jgi:penicillin-insensitive murein endopeptidase
MTGLKWLLSLFFSAFAGGCLPWSSLDPATAGPMGGTSHGGLRGGIELPHKGDHHLFYRPQRDRRHACPTLGRALLSAAQQVAQSYPSSRLVIGDLSAPGGGKISGHRSHQNGLDADLGFFRRTLTGKPAPPGTDHRFDRFGVALVRHRGTLFDEERNLALVEALLANPHAEIQWIFVSHATKRRLLETALRKAVATDTIERMNTVLRRPGDSTPHDDHFHVRAFCPPHAALCIDNGPTWDWTPLARARKQPDWFDGGI